MVLSGGLVRIDPAACTGCGNCVRACPKAVLELAPRAARVLIHCASRDKGKEVSEVCQAGCISCGMCVKKCPAEAVRLEAGRIMIDQEKCLAHGPACEEICATSCPRSILRRTGESAPPAQAPQPEVQPAAGGQEG